MRFLLAALLAVAMYGSPTFTTQGLVAVGTVMASDETLPERPPESLAPQHGGDNKVPAIQSVVQAGEVRVGGLMVAANAEPDSGSSRKPTGMETFAFALQPTFLFSEEIACEGNITSDMQFLVDAEKPFLIGPGDCFFDTIKVQNGIRFSGSGHPNTKLHYTGSGSTYWQDRNLPDLGPCAFEPARDRPMGGIYMAGFELELDQQGRYNGWCGAFANGARIEDVYCQFGKSCVIWMRTPEMQGDPAEGFTQIFVNFFSRNQFGCTFDIRGSVLATFVHGDVGRNNGSPVVCYENARSDQSALVFIGYVWMGNRAKVGHKTADTMIRLNYADGLALSIVGGNYSGPESQNFVTVERGRASIEIDNLNFSGNPRKPHFCAKVIDMPGRSVSCKDAHLSRIHVN